MNHGLTPVIVGAASVAVLMLALWLIHLRTGNAAIVDAGWAGGLALLGALYAVLGGGYWLRSAMIGTMSTTWGLRLAIYLLTTRIIGHPEEGRYRELRRQWKTNIPFKFLLFYEFQALLCVVLAVPFLGEIPLHMSIRLTSDSGTPVVESEPDGPHAAIYRAIGAKVRDQLRGVIAAA